MGINTALTGRVYPPVPVYEVGREKIAEFAAAVGSADPAHTDVSAARALGYPDVIAPPTFAVVVAQRAEALVMRDPDANIDYTRLVHGDERFVHHRPIVAGDLLTATLHIDSARAAGGHGMLMTRVEIVDADGAPVTTVRSTAVIRGGE
jgi:acyl dehydratase